MRAAMESNDTQKFASLLVAMSPDFQYPHRLFCDALVIRSLECALHIRDKWLRDIPFPCFNLGFLIDDDKPRTLPALQLFVTTIPEDPGQTPYLPELIWALRSSLLCHVDVLRWLLQFVGPAACFAEIERQRGRRLSVLYIDAFARFLVSVSGGHFVADTTGSSRVPKSAFTLLYVRRVFYLFLRARGFDTASRAAFRHKWYDS